VVESAEIDVNLGTPQSVRKLQRVLYAKAKANPTYRCYRCTIRSTERCAQRSLEPLSSKTTEALALIGQSFEGIESKGVERWLEQLAQEMRTKTLPAASGTEGLHS